MIIIDGSNIIVFFIVFGIVWGMLYLCYKLSIKEPPQKQEQEK